MEEQKNAEVLIIEDEEMLASMYKAKFEREGFAVTVAYDGEDGLAKAKSGDYAVVLVDIIMPKLDGFSVLKSLRAAPAYKDKPIYLLTNLGQEEDMAKGNELGATGYLVKANFTPSQVVNQVKDHLTK